MHSTTFGNNQTPCSLLVELVKGFKSQISGHLSNSKWLAKIRSYPKHSSKSMKKKRIVLLQWPNRSPGLNRLKCWGRILRELCTMQSPQTSISLSNVVKKSGTKFHNGLRGWWSQYLKKTLQVQKKIFFMKKMLLLLKVLWVYLAFHRAAAKTALKTIFFRWLYRSVQKVNNITVITMSSFFSSSNTLQQIVKHSQQLRQISWPQCQMKARGMLFKLH